VELDGILASMPLHIWRAAQVLPLSTHPNDPPQSHGANATEFLTTFEVTFPDGVSETETTPLTEHPNDPAKAEVSEIGVTRHTTG
jgi:muconolactone delta-isomerase